MLSDSRLKLWPHFAILDLTFDPIFVENGKNRAENQTRRYEMGNNLHNPIIFNYWQVTVG